MGRALPISCLILAALSVVGEASAADPPRPVDQFNAALRDHRRLELVVSSGFDAACQPGETPETRHVVTCALTAPPKGLYRLLGPLHDGLLANVVMDRTQGVPDVVKFELAAANLRFRDSVFDLPRRWVIEIGRPVTLSPQVEDEQPFRPYPMRLSGFEAPLPPAILEPLDEEATLAAPYNLCLAQWRQGQLMKALRQCEAMIKAAPKQHWEAQAVKRAWRVVAEARYRLAEEGRGREEALINALEKAEAGIEAPWPAFRYAALAVSWMGDRLPGKASKWLDEREARYTSSNAEPDYRAALAGLLLKTDEREKALPLLEEAGRTSYTDAHRRRFVGTAKLALAGLAYEARRYRKSLMIYDRLAKDWPGLLMEDPASVFRFAELLTQAGRYEEARRLYIAFLEHFPKAHPFYVVQVRLAQLLTLTDLGEAERAFAQLNNKLPGTQAQNLVLLYQSQMTNRPEVKYKILRRIKRTAQTDYVRGAVWVALVNEAIGRGDIRQGYELLKELRQAIPQEPTLMSAPSMWPRVLYLLLSNYLHHDRNLAAISLYYDEQLEFERHPYRAEVHLRVGKALREMYILEEALAVLQRGLSSESEAKEKDAVARTYLEMAGVLRESEDAFRLGRALEYLDRSFPRKFDNFEYWMAQGTRAWWAGELEEARDIFRYAINGPVSVDERTELTEALARLYEEMKAWESAVRAWEAVADFHDEGKGLKAHPRRRGALWRAAEIEFEQARWIPAVGALDRFIGEYPTDRVVPEAQFLIAKALLAAGSARSAVEALDRLSRRTPEGPYTRMAKEELDLLKWSKQVAPEVMKTADLEGRRPDASPSTP